MSNKKREEKLQQIKDAINNSNELSEEEKSEAIRLIEEWYAEDRGFEQLVADMEALEAKIADFLRRLGFD